MSIWSFVFMMLGFPSCMMMPAAVVLGHIALAQIKSNGQRGRSMAVAGIVGAWVGMVAYLAVLLYWFAQGAGEAFGSGGH